MNTEDKLSFELSTRKDTISQSKTCIFNNVGTLSIIQNYRKRVLFVCLSDFLFLFLFYSNVAYFYL